MSISYFAYLCLFFTLTTTTLAATVKTTGAHYMGDITSTNSILIRDVGTHGNIGRWRTNSYGDTFRCKDQFDQSTCIPMASNTLSYTTADPLKVTDFNVGGPDQVPNVFCGTVPAWNEEVGDTGIGISNIVPTSADELTGVVFVWREHRPAGQPHQMLGSGVAIVDGSGAYPTCHRTAPQWWDSSTEPTWGDHSIVDGRDGFLYAYGQIGAKLELYLLRVPLNQATTLSAYRYWNGNEFTSERLVNPSSDAIVLRGNTQGSIWWSEHHGMWASLSRHEYNLQAFTMALSENLWGPWGDASIIFEAPTLVPGAWCYAPTMHPQYDMTMKSLVFSYTQQPNIQQAARVYFA